MNKGILLAAFIATSVGMQAELDMPHVSFDQSMACNVAWKESSSLRPNRAKAQTLRDLYIQNNFSVAQIQEESVIPKIIHQIWVGGPVPEKYDEWRQSWQDMHPDWEYKLWTDADIPSLHIHNRAIYDKAPDFAAKADVLKYEILYQFGGMYVDIDFECLQSFDGLHHRYNFYSGISNERTFAIALGLLGAAPGHPILKHCIEAARPKLLQMGRMGPGYFTARFFEAL